MKEKFERLLKEVRAAGGTTAELLSQLPDNGGPHRQINEMDSWLSVWEDQIEVLIDELNSLEATEQGG